MLSAGDRTIVPSRGLPTSAMFTNTKVDISNKMAVETQRNQLSQQQANAGQPSAQNSQDASHKQHIWIVTGPAGCGKTTVAVGLSKAFDLPYVEGDDYHPQSNKDKMANNIPLNDADRWDWLIQLREAAVKALSTPKSSDSTAYPTGVVVTCSALKHKYRDVMRIAAYEHPSVSIHFIYLRADEEELMERVQARQGHFMKSDMVRSQFTALEEPTEEEWDADCVECGKSRTQDQVLQEAISVVKKASEQQNP
ncbi:hypothetical protein KEM56_006144 [Ascosphaera pollenicola]|nr:hypothetical protein KEM56_006144 [Ascosphaera pollenicola]